MAVEDIIKNLQEMPSKLDEIEALIEEDGKGRSADCAVASKKRY